MRPASLPLPDAEERRRAENDYESSHLVEASAGTGKTTILISRIVSILKGGGRRLPEIAAMTFTEKAAGEMKGRLRAALDEALAGRRDETDAESRANLEQARRELESAEVSTIHSFCARLLREQPVSAGVDPDFTASDESLAAALLADVFDAWLDREARKKTSPVHAALASGASPNGILSLALELLKARALIDGATLPSDPLGEAQREIDTLVRRFEGLLDNIPRELRSDAKAVQMADALGELREVRLLPFEKLARWEPATALDFKRGKRNAFEGALREELNSCRGAFKAFADRCAALPHEAVLAGLVREIVEGLFSDIEREKERLGILDFDDLLLKTRDLLRRSPGVREYFRERFKTLVVDEFQDTDPVQAEIVFRLAAGEPQDETEWRDLEPAPGALFIVGDPKQSIYRFRRADVESYRLAKERFAEENRLTLRTNFRSDPRILEYVNTVLAPAMVDDQAAPRGTSPAPLSAPPEKGPGTVPAVVYLEPPLDPYQREAGGEESEDREDEGESSREAFAIANFLLARHGAAPFERWSDIAVLVYRNRTVDLFQEVFRKAGIPAVLEGGRSFFDREETAAVIAAMRAVDDPGDGVSTVAALKSFLFGLSDLDLLDAAEAGGRFDDWATIPPGTAAGEALALLTRLHADRYRRPLSETMADLFASRSAFAAMEAGAVLNGVQGTANLERLLVLARGLDGEGLSFREGVGRLALRLESAEGEPRAFADELDAVKLITIHKAKGLEFRVVVLADLGLRTKRETTDLFFDRAGGEYGVSLGFGGRKVQTPGAGRIREASEARRRAEEKRFLYVGLTRAREALVVSWFRRRTAGTDGEVSDQIDRSLLGPIARFEKDDGLLSSLVEVVAADVREPAAAETVPAEPLTGVEAAMEAAETRLAMARETAGRPLRRAGEKPGIPAALGLETRPEDLSAIDRDDEAEARSRAIRIGIAVHETMERHLSPEAPLPLEEAIAESTRALAREERAEAGRLARRLARDPVTARALAARRRFVELPLLYRDGRDDVDGPTGQAGLVEGKIDLLFEEDDGFVVVDWKTERVDRAEDMTSLQERYAPQLEAYEKGLTLLLGASGHVKEKHLVFARWK